MATTKRVLTADFPGCDPEVRLVLHAVDARTDPRSGDLLFDLRAFTGYAVKLGLWDSGLALERIVGRSTTTLDDDPVLAFLNQLGGLEPTSPVTRWAEPLPAALIDLVRRMDRGQLSVLRLVRHCPAALDLLGGGENLLWLAAAVAAERKAPWEELAAIFQRKRRDVVEWCGGENSKAAVKAVEEYRMARFTRGGAQRVARACGTAQAARPDTRALREPQPRASSSTRSTWLRSASSPASGCATRRRRATCSSCIRTSAGWPRP